MQNLRPSGAGFDLSGPEFDEEFQNILSALFCACQDDVEDTDTRLRRALLRLTQVEGQTPAQAAHALNLELNQVEDMLEKTRRDIAVLMALGLFIPEGDGPGGQRPATGCQCSNTRMAQRRDPPPIPGSCAS
mgnify:FL=1|tara:strand:+ start:14106 stop:14501 length:396 start_codon:yes stop_codon:yes gene_type:complete